MSTNRDHQADQPKGTVWEGWRKLDVYRFGRQDTIREGLAVYRSKGSAGLVEWLERLGRVLDTAGSGSVEKGEGENG